VIEAPPHIYVQTLEEWAPGFWDRFFSAVWAGYYRYGKPMQVTSWWRTVSRNADAGGHPESQHLVGTAFDVLPADPALEGAMEMAGFIGVMRPTHLHLQAFPAGLLRQVGFLSAVGI